MTPRPFSLRTATNAPAARRQRRGYTLLEVILALGIGVLLLAGLYVALDIQISGTHSGREIAQQSTVARQVLSRIQDDIAASLGPVDPKLISNSNSSPSTTTTTTTTNNTTTTTTSNTTPADSASGPVNFNLMVWGDETTLILYINRVPRDSDFDGETVCDLRRVTYWLAGGGNNPLGLARQEVRQITSDSELGVVPPDVADEGSYVIAPQVQTVSFAYWDGSEWATSWDGTVLGPDNKTPIGPPAAIAVTITVTRPSRAGQPPDPSQTRTYRHVVAILTANGATASSGSSTTSGGN